MSDSYAVAETPVVQPAPDEPWAPWHLRVAASLVDAALGLPFIVISVILTVIAQDPESTEVVRLLCGLLSLVNAIASIVFAVWNQIFRQGRRGATLGKQCFGLLVISMGNARPIGPIMTFVRYWAHLLDALPLCLGYLWPIWDEKKQTFADKVAHTAVLRLPGVRF